MMPSIIEIQSMTKRYKNADYHSLQGIDLSIPKGSVFGLLGTNGAGKTTLISILCGLIKATSGSFTIDGLSPEKQLREIKSKIGIVPQEYALYPTLTAYENLMYFGSLYNIPRQKLKILVEEYLSMLGLESFMHKKIQTFSGGMKRRVNLIAGILHQPEILFLNELNQKGTTIVYTSHLMAEAQEFCTDIAIIDQGKILTKGTVYQLMNQVPGAVSLEEVFISLTGRNLRDVV